MSDRPLPCDLQAEKAVLGALVVDNSLAPVVASLLRPSDFFRAGHAMIYEEIMKLADRQAPIDLVVLVDALTRRGVLEDIGGPAYLASLTDGVPKASNIEAYAEVVLDRSYRRQLIKLTHDGMGRAYDGADVHDILDTFGRDLFNLARGKRGELLAMDQVVNLTMPIIEMHANADRPVIGLETGFHKLDKMTSGLRPQNMIVLAARPGMGKTSMVLNVANNVAVKQRKPVAFFSLEMTKEELCMRQIAALAQVDGTRMLMGRLSEVEYQRVGEAAAELSEAPMFIDDGSDLTLFDLRARCRALKHKRGLALIVVDYLQLMAGDPKAENRSVAIAQISRGLKTLAKELEVPVIAISQLNRANEARKDKRPMLSDLRESGALEQDADVVLFIHREEEYKADDDNRGKGEFILGKQRNGPTGTVVVGWNGSQTRFYNLDSGELRL